MYLVPNALQLRYDLLQNSKFIKVGLLLIS